MDSTFWSNTIWYVILGIITIIEIIFAMVKAERRKLTFAFFLTILSFTLSIETTILIFLKAYTYYPMILQSAKIPFDNVLAGNLFSQFSISATMLLIVVLNLKNYWFFIFAGIYGAIEELFLALGIYSHNWYQTWMTVILLPFAFWIAKKMYTKILQGVKPIFYYGYVFLGLFSLNIISLTWGFMLLELQEFSQAVLSDPISSRHFLVLVYFFLVSISMMIIYFLRPNWMWKALIILLLYTIYYISYKLNLMFFKEGWFLFVSTVTFVWMYLSVVIMDKLYGGAKNCDSGDGSLTH